MQNENSGNLTGWQALKWFGSLGAILIFIPMIAFFLIPPSTPSVHTIGIMNESGITITHPNGAQGNTTLLKTASQNKKALAFLAYTVGGSDYISLYNVGEVSLGHQVEFKADNNDKQALLVIVDGQPIKSFFTTKNGGTGRYDSAPRKINSSLIHDVATWANFKEFDIHLFDQEPHTITLKVASPITPSITLYDKKGGPTKGDLSFADGVYKAVFHRPNTYTNMVEVEIGNKSHTYHFLCLGNEEMQQSLVLEFESGIWRKSFE